VPVSFYVCYDYAYPLEVFRSADIFVFIPVAMQSAGVTRMAMKIYKLHCIFNTAT
jgi:hypothetical protein